MLDLLIENGLVIDGSGSPGFHAAVAVQDERVTIHRGDASHLEAARTIDASGHVVCPGFVDLHSTPASPSSARPTTTRRCARALRRS